MGDLADDVLSNVFWPLLGDGGDDAQGIEDLEARVRRNPRGSALVGMGECARRVVAQCVLTPTLVGPPEVAGNNRTPAPERGAGRPGAWQAGLLEGEAPEGRANSGGGRGVAQCAAPL